jgi:hypothetical protein
MLEVGDVVLTHRAKPESGIGPMWGEKWYNTLGYVIAIPPYYDENYQLYRVNIGTKDCPSYYKDELFKVGKL